MKKINVGMAVAVMAVLFSGCGSSAPKCSDETGLEVLSGLVKEAMYQSNREYSSSYGGGGAYNAGYAMADRMIAQENNKRLKEQIENAEYDFSGFSTKKSDKESKSAVCQAELSIIMGDKVDSRIVEYSVRYSDDKSKIYVDLTGLN
ncbi:hypothetical protein ACWIUD_05725 [Helicobacter sp. 23-1044]